MKFLNLLALVPLLAPLQAEDPWLTFEGNEGPGKGKKVVLISGDEEYRSEESFPMLGKLLAEKHGFDCTVLFSIDKETGEINPDEQTNIPGMSAIADADFVIMCLRFRELPDKDTKFLADHIEAGKPLLGLRTSTHAFKYGRLKNSPYAKFSFNSKEWSGGFGRQILGETWINHHGHHGKESTRGVINEAQADHPLLRGVEDVWGPSDVYGIKKLPEDAKVLLYGQVLTGMNPNDPAIEGEKNDPMMPVAWVREDKKVITSTMGAATDFVHPGLRRFVVNSTYWATGLDIPETLDVEPVDEFKPSDFGFKKYLKGKKPADFR
ncbi:MAG: ThuA domain-containing protein [Verrucomicrobiales bacterium]